MNVSSSGSTTSSTTSSKYSSSGLSGLFSGMDTESMVKKMLSGTQTKIDKQKQSVQRIQWKQSFYREAITGINKLRSKYFDSSYGASITNNLASRAFFNQHSSTVSGSGVKVISTSSSAQVGDMSVAVAQLATQASLTSTQTMSGDRTISGTALTDAQLTKDFGKTVALKVGDTDVQVTFNNATTQQEIADAFNKALTDASVSGVTAKVYDGHLRLVTDSEATKVTLNAAGSSALGMQAAGFNTVSNTQIKDVNENVTGNMLQGGTMEADAGVSIQLSLDGVTKTLKLNQMADASGNITVQSAYESLSKASYEAFGNYVKVGLTGGAGSQKLTLSVADGTGTNGVGHELNVYGADAPKLGIVAGASTSVNTSTKLSALTGLSGDRYSFTINNKSFTFSASDSIGTVINTVNKSNAGVKMSYSSLSDTFSMEATSSGSQYGIELSQEQGNLLSVMFGADKVAAASTAASKSFTTTGITGTALADDYTTAKATLNITVNGKAYTYTASTGDDTGAKKLTKTEIEQGFNTFLKSTFGTQEGSDAANISYADGKLSIAKGYSVSFSASTVDPDDAAAVAAAKTTDLAYAMGFNTKATSNTADAGTKISDVEELAGKTRLLDKDGNAAQTLGDIASVDGIAVTYKDGRLTTAESDLSTSATLQELFGKTNLGLGDGKEQAGAVKAGQDAIAIVNGTEIRRSSNNFTIDGITMQLTKESTYTEVDGKKVYDAATITTGMDSDSIVNTLKDFVKDYNDLIGNLQKKVTEDATYKNYAPLTDEQKKEMSESEITQWTEKAKTGLLRNDNTIESFLSDMRSALYATSASSNLRLYDLGIDTFDKTGKLSLDESKLRNALSSDPEAVTNLFTDATNGISKKLTDVMDGAAKLSSGSPGSLVQLAGAEDLASTLKNNTLYSQILNINDRIDQLEDRYNNEKDRYWSMFTHMETAMTNYNSQMAMINSYFSS